jgi:hypothetical protein
MRILFTLCLLASCAISSAQSTPPLSLNRTIPLTGVTGKFDHLAIDTAGNRLFIAATGNHSVEVIDLKTDKVEAEHHRPGQAARPGLGCGHRQPLCRRWRAG